MKIFINYAREDYQFVKRIYEKFRTFEEFTPWIDKENLLPGMDWEEEILTAIDDSKYIIIVLSKNAVEKVGFVQTEIKKAIGRFSKFPPGKLFLIPVRIDDSKPKYRELLKLQYIDLFPEDQFDIGFEQIIKSIKYLSEKTEPLSSDTKSNLTIKLEDVKETCTPIFGSNKTIHISYQKCNNATQFVSIDKKNWRINWKWEEKSNTWCGWGTDSLPSKNLSKYLNGFLYVIFCGEFDKQPPEAKFIDFNEQHSSLVNFSSFMSNSDEKSMFVAKIPIESFFGDDPDFYPADPANIKFMQFDAEYSSDNGKVSIIFIGISNK